MIREHKHTHTEEKLSVLRNNVWEYKQTVQKVKVQGKTGAALCIPGCEAAIKQRTLGRLAVFSVGRLAIITTLQWAQDHRPQNMAISSDAVSAFWCRLARVGSLRIGKTFQVT